jgi:hypothetical protein
MDKEEMAEQRIKKYRVWLPMELFSFVEWTRGDK